MRKSVHVVVVATACLLVVVAAMFTNMFSILYPYLKFTLGTLYPAYKTWKALKRKDETTRRRWMKYWVSFSAFQLFEIVADITIAFILPFYILLKLAILWWIIWGTKLIFDSIVNRELAKREKSIDRWLTKTNKIRGELIAIIWYELSRCTITLVTSIMAGGLSALAKLPESERPSNPASPVYSDEDEEEMAVVQQEEREQESKQSIEQQDFNENVVSMEWSAIRRPAIKHH